MKSILTAVMLLISQMSIAQVTVSWFNFPGGVAVARDAVNNVYTANWDYNAGGDITLTKRDASGNIIWEVPYNNTDFTSHEVATWVATDNAGNILVSGTIRSGYSNPVNAASILMKYNPSGTLLWRVVYESSFDGSSTRKCLVDASNNIYVLGLGTGPAGQVTKVKKFNSSGITVWNYFDNGGGAPVNFKFTPDNNIVLVKRGITGIINSYSKIDLNGNLIWNTAGITSISGGDASGDAFGNTYIVNGSPSELKKLSPAGAVIWTRPNTNVNGNKVEVGTDNNPVVGGYPGAGYGVVIMKYDANGNLLWQNLDADGPSLSLLALAPMRLDGSNAVYIAGSTMSSMGVCKVNSDGTSAWSATTSSGYPVWFEFGTDNSIYVVGGTTARFTQSGTIPTPPVAPSNLVATPAGTSSINLTWADNSTNETGFVLMQSSTSGGIFNKLITIPANTTSYTDVGLGSSATYYYKIQATNAGGNSTWSNQANATTNTPPATIPAAPSNLVATASGTSIINLTWIDNASNETSYVLQRSLSSASGFAVIATLGSNSTSYSNTGLNSSTTYYYRVQAVNAADVSVWSNTANATTVALPPPTIPAAPTNLVAMSAGCNQVSLKWTDNSSNETAFEVSRASSLNGTYTIIATLGANSRAYTDNGLRTSRRYYYRIRCKNTAGVSSWSNKANAVAVCNTITKVVMQEQKVLLFPNPAVNEINVQLPDTYKLPLTLDIVSPLGQKVFSKQINNYTTKIPVEGLTKGWYVIQLRNGGTVEAIKFLIN
ncbi:MAG: fibronectin type III domain-containing protein [Chitinophagaceae bacterium]|nr:fibronectin type III domain-containing protein [Chitinophagaceae bacterium]